MKGITLTAPWGTLVAVGEKRIETRSWGTSYRGPIAIHQAKGLNGLLPPDKVREPKTLLEQRLADLCDSDPFFTALRPHLSGYTKQERAADLPRGCIVATAQLIDVVPTDDFKIEDTISNMVGNPSYLIEHEQALGDYTPGRYAWILQRVLNLHDGIECKGGRGLWDVPDDILAEIRTFDDTDE